MHLNISDFERTTDHTAMTLARQFFESARMRVNVGQWLQGQVHGWLLELFPFRSLQNNTISFIIVLSLIVTMILHFSGKKGVKKN